MRTIKLGLPVLTLLLAFFCCQYKAMAEETYFLPDRNRAAGGSAYDRFKSPPLPIEIVSNLPFAFEVSDKHKKAKLKPWSALVKKENKNPTFDREKLLINDPILAEYWAKLFDRLLFAGLEEKLTYVNHFMNRFDYGEDIMVWGVEDYWATPREYMEKKIGDCKAIAIAKYYALRELRVDTNNMYIATVNDPTAGRDSYHVVLVVMDGSDRYVLDMQNNRGVTKNSAYKQYKIYDYFNETECREVIK